ncbi:hypothetical protein ZPAH1_orf00335 [Aeromonas phage ZPAH1]|nr:hypothetical protein ZPAH1_orf00335 [Aeromonas phage ZPAH1]
MLNSNDLPERMLVRGRYEFRSLEARYDYRTRTIQNRFNYELLKDGFRIFHIDEDENVIAICSLDDVHGERPFYLNDGTVFINRSESVLFIRKIE